ncbi:hypothetical protein AAG906_037022 [Vitis piasezkii]
MEKDPSTTDPLQPLRLSDSSDHVTYGSSLLTLEELKILEGVLQQNKDVFAWTYSDMSGIHPSKVRRFHPDRQKIIQSEVDKLLASGFIREVEYLDWLANVVVVPKKREKWRVCVDYTNLNNNCPKDSFPLPRIDEIVDSTVEHGILSFIDAFFEYHQIPMFQPDEEKTAFLTPHMLYYYKVMPLGLKNVGATYQWSEHTLHLKETFCLMRVYNMKLNPAKCTICHLAALGHFITRFTNKLRPFFLTLKRANVIGWMDDYEQAFEEIKHYLTQPPILSSPQPGEQLYMYLAVSNCAVSVVLFRHMKGKEQRPVYYVSKAMVDAKTQ